MQERFRLSAGPLPARRSDSHDRQGPRRRSDTGSCQGAQRADSAYRCQRRSLCLRACHSCEDLRWDLRRIRWSYSVARLHPGRTLCIPELPSCCSTGACASVTGTPFSCNALSHGSAAGACLASAAVARVGVPAEEVAIATSFCAEAGPCVGDCNGDCSVSVDELITGANLLLAGRRSAIVRRSSAACPSTAPRAVQTKVSREPTPAWFKRCATQCLDAALRPCRSVPRSNDSLRVDAGTLQPVRPLTPG